MTRLNDRSHQLYLQYLDLVEKIRHATGDEKEELYSKYAVEVFDMCSHYEKVYSKLEQDMNAVKEQLLSQF